MAKPIKTRGKIFIITVILGIVGGALWWLNDSKTVNIPSLSSIYGGNSAEYDAELLLDPYTGWAPIIWGNGGKEPNDTSYFYKMFGVKLKITVSGAFDAATAYWKEHNNSLRFCTLDSYPVEASQDGTMTDARYFMIHNFSAGADAIVATKNIKTVQDLKGKKIACSEGTASHSLLLNTLATSGLGGSDVTMVAVNEDETSTGPCVDIVVTEYGSDVAQAFKAGAVDAAVVFCPDDDSCIREVPGAHVVTSTKQANTLVTDGFLAHSGWLNNNPEKAKKIAEALLWANSEITHNQNAYNEACAVFARETEFPLEDCLTVGKKINFATVEDNVNWFGFNSNYTGVTAEELYKKMTFVYSNIGLAKTTMSWPKISNTSIVEALMANNDISNDQSANGTKQKTFAVTEKIKTAEAMSDKKVIIEFPVDGYTLSEDAEVLITREFLPIVKQFNTMYVKIEGNTDNTGSYQHNVELSKKRAQSVVNFLIRNGVDKARIFYEGNGPENAIKAGVKGSSQAYRTTDLKLIAE
jgi:NitT/TauT family transport system substrate-binding protein